MICGKKGHRVTVVGDDGQMCMHILHSPARRNYALMHDGRLHIISTNFPLYNDTRYTLYVVSGNVVTDYKTGKTTKGHGEQAYCLSILLKPAGRGRYFGLSFGEYIRERYMVHIDLSDYPNVGISGVDISIGYPFYDHVRDEYVEITYGRAVKWNRRQSCHILAAAGMQSILDYYCSNDVRDGMLITVRVDMVCVRDRSGELVAKYDYDRLDSVWFASESVICFSAIDLVLINLVDGCQYVISMHV